MPDVPDLIICSTFLLLFTLLIKTQSRLRRSLYYVIQSSQISNPALCNMFLILQRREEGIQRRRNRPHVWVYPRNQLWFEEINRNPSMHCFCKDHFRMNLDSFREIFRVLQPFLAKRDTRFREAIPIEKRVAIALWRLGTGEKYRSTAVTFGVGKCTALNIVHEFVQALFQIRENYISFPLNGRELDQVKQKFELKHDLPQVAGVIDGTHIKIKAPKEEHEAYYNRKQCYSLVLQAITDSEGRFSDVSVGYPGSVHDARVFRSELHRRIIAGDIMGATRVINHVNVRPYLVGDTAYPLSPFIVTAFQGGGLTPAQERFNRVLTKLRVVVERALGKLKTRWRCIFKELEDDTERVLFNVLACCILHNFCIIMGDDLDNSDEDDDSDDDNDDDEDGRQDDVGGQEIRRVFTEFLSG